MFRIRFYTDVLPKPLFGKVVFENPWRSKMDGSDDLVVAVVADQPVDSEVKAVASSSSKTLDIALSKSAELAEEKPQESTESVVFFSGNPEIDVSKGVLRLFKDNMSEDSNVFAGDVPTKRSDLVCLLAVPAHYSSDEICRFLKQYTRFMLQIRVLRDQRPDRLVLVMRFCSQEKADEFFREFNGTRFNEVEPERCRVAFLSSVEFLEPRDAELFVSVSHQHEMPTCPVCLERLEEQASGIFVTLCNHSFHCSCLAQWRSSETACPVCRYTLRCTGAGEEHASRCDRCATTEALWICLICGNVGCSRYRGAHASEHWRETGHIYALELDTQRVWDYAGDGYVHRLIQNKTDGKVVELPSPFQKTDYREPEKIQKVVTEYNFLLLSQLEAQRAYFEDLVEKARLESAGPGETELAHEVKRLNKVLAQQTQQLNQIKDKMLAVMRENQFLKEVNAAQESDRARWETVLQKHAAERAAAAEQMREMQDQLRDLMFFVEAQKAVQAQDGALEEGGVVKISKQAVPPPVKTPGSGNKKNKKKK